ncbi:MAG: hypothetical protein JW836_17055 [Deltaproteobacteria bacterium]|nr:hypothetical protein [Deltaproteobacteria bacterium]
MVSINATLVLQVVHLLVLVFILNRLMFRPILKLINERDSFLEKSKLDMTNVESEAERLRRVFLAQEGDARKKALRQGMDIKSAALNEVEKLTDESAKSASSIRAEAEEIAKKQVETTKPLLGGQAKILAEEIVIKLLGRRLGA